MPTALAYLVGDVAGRAPAGRRDRLREPRRPAPPRRRSPTDGRRPAAARRRCPSPGLGAQRPPLDRFEPQLAGARGRARPLALPAAPRGRAAARRSRRGSTDPRSRSAATSSGSCTARRTCSARDEDARAALVTSANLTGAGLHRNLELGLVDYNPAVPRRRIAWFDDAVGRGRRLRGRAARPALPRPRARRPARRSTCGRCSSCTATSSTRAAPSRGSTRLAAGALPARRLRAGAAHRSRATAASIYADGVGTGKTEIGLAFIEEYALKEDGVYALVVCPAQLKLAGADRPGAAARPRSSRFNELAADEQLVPEAPRPPRATCQRARTPTGSSSSTRRTRCATRTRPGTGRWSGCSAASARRSCC